jgi:drug/metabolite transporter (DMT)-like permease
MWHALRAELVYFRMWLLGALGIAAGVSVMMLVIKWFVDDAEGIPGFLTSMFLFIAGMVVSIIVQSYRWEERRTRLLLAGTLTPRQLAGVLVILPACFMSVGALAAVIMIGLTALITGNLDHTDLRMTAVFGLEFWAYAQMGPLVQEAAAARRQGRGRAAIVGWMVFAGAILLLAMGMFFRHLIQANLGQMLAIVMTMVVAAAIYQGRTDFTR